MTEVEGIVATAGMVAALWGAILLWRGGILGGCLAVLLSGCCLGYPLFHIPAQPIPVTLDRVLWLILMAQCVLWRRFGWAAPRPLGRADATLGILLLLLSLSALGIGAEAADTKAIAKLVFFFVMPVGIYWAARQADPSDAATTWLLVCLTLFGLYLSVTAVGERYDLGWLVIPPYILSAEHAEFLGRARGPLLSPIGNGILFGTCSAAALLLFARTGRWTRLALGLSLVFMLGGTFLTLTRSVWMGVGLGLILVGAIQLPPVWRKTVVASALIAAVLVVITQWENLQSFKRDKAVSAEEMAESAKLRPILAAVAWKMFLDRPLWGCGFGRYTEVAKEYFSDRSMELPLERARPYVQHNVLLALLTETGLIGAGLFSMLLALWARDAWRLWRSPRASLAQRQLGPLFLAAEANYLVNGMFHDVAIIPMVNMLLFFFAGLVEGSRCPHEQTGTDTACAAAPQHERKAHDAQPSGEWRRAK